MHTSTTRRKTKEDCLLAFLLHLDPVFQLKKRSRTGQFFGVQCHTLCHPNSSSSNQHHFFFLDSNLPQFISNHLKIMNTRSLSRMISHLGMIWLALAVYVCREPPSRTTLRRFAAWQTLVLSAVSFLLYAMDKMAAKITGAWRIPEFTLHAVSLCGGWPGAALAQQVFRHKRRKEAFLRVFCATVVGYFALLWVFVSYRIIG